MNYTGDAIQVRAPSRLHFGLLSFNNPDVPEFGGVGLMVDAPGIVLEIRPADHFQCSGVHANRVVTFANKWSQYFRTDLPACTIDVTRAADQHVGLGLGTQLGLATAAGLTRFALSERVTAADLARSVGRGKRSAIGTHGFEQGGFLFELGKKRNEDVSRLQRRVVVPDNWRIILIRPDQHIGLSGEIEQTAFNELPAVPKSTTSKLTSEIVQRMIPAIENDDLPAFARSVANYGELAGQCFALCQGGSYASPQLQEIVVSLREEDIYVGQSSWGPTLFTFAESETMVDSVVQTIIRRGIHAEVDVTAPNNTGVRISRLAE